MNNWITLNSISIYCTDVTWSSWFLSTLMPRQNGRHFVDISKWTFLNENIRILIETFLKFVTMGPIDNIQALVQIMAWHRPGDKPLPEPMTVNLVTHICVTRLQWVNCLFMLTTKKHQHSAYLTASGPLFTIVKSRSREIGCCNGRIALKFDRHLGSNAAEVPAKFQSDWKSLNPNLAASRLHEILR